MVLQLPPSVLDNMLWQSHQRDHWSPASQPYTSADVLLQHLANGWNIKRVVDVAHYQLPSRRLVTVYSFELLKEAQTLVLPVLNNPIVRTLLHQCQIQHVPFCRERNRVGNRTVAPSRQVI